MFYLAVTVELTGSFICCTNDYVILTLCNIVKGRVILFPVNSMILCLVYQQGWHYIIFSCVFMRGLYYA